MLSIGATTSFNFKCRNHSHDINDKKINDCPNFSSLGSGHSFLLRHLQFLFGVLNSTFADNVAITIANDIDTGTNHFSFGPLNRFISALSVPSEAAAKCMH